VVHLQRRVIEVELLAQHQFERAAGSVAVDARRDKHVGRQDWMPGRKLPQVQIVDLFHVLAVRHRDADVARREPLRRSLQEHANRLLLQRPARAQHQPGHEERRNRVGAIEAGRQNDDARDKRSGKGVEVGDDVLKAAFDIETLAVGLRQNPRRRKIDCDASPSDDCHREPADVRWMDQPHDRLVDDDGAEDEQHGAVGLPAEHLGAAAAVGQTLAARLLHVAENGERQRKRAGVGQHMRRVGQQGEGVRHDPDDDFERHEADDQDERDGQVARVGIRLDPMGVIVARVVVMVIIVIVRMCVPHATNHRTAGRGRVKVYNVLSHAILHNGGCVTFTRRQLLLGAVAAVLVRPREAGASQLAFPVPAGACDCHTHVFGDPTRFPFWSGRTYTPPAADVAAWQDVHLTLRMDRGVVVQPSVYGTDNSCLLDALKQLGRRARGIAVIADAAPAAELDALHRLGVRGIRVNLETFGIADPAAASERLRRSLAQLAHRAWHVQLFVRSSIVPKLESAVLESPLPIVFDHFGGVRAEAGLNDPGFQSLVRMVRAGKTYVKVSAAYRVSSSGPPDYADVRPFARALIDANPERVLWGSDWPHPDSRRRDGHEVSEISPNLPVDDVATLNQLAVWAPDAAVRRMILVDNPARLYGF